MVGWFGQWNTLFGTLAAVSALVLISLGIIAVIEEVVTQRVMNTIIDDVAAKAAELSVEHIGGRFETEFGADILKKYMIFDDSAKGAA